MTINFQPKQTAIVIANWQSTFSQKNVKVKNIRRQQNEKQKED